MDRRVYKPIKHSFTPDEIRELGEALARESQSVIDLKDQKANIMAGFSAQLKAGDRKVADLTIKINNGYEVRDIECMYLYDTPRIGMKTLVRCDNSVEQGIEAMSLEEQQTHFNFPDEGQP